MAVILAYFGFGVYALVFQHVFSSIVAAILVWSLVSWRPKVEFSFDEIRRLFRFSFYVFTATSLNKLIAQLDSLIIGRLFSANTLGFYNRALGLNNLITQNTSTSLGKVFFPAMVNIKDDILRFNSVFLKLTDVVSSIAIFLMGFFFLTADKLIVFLFGIQWVESIPLFSILILKAFSFPLGSLVVNAFLARGCSRENFHIGNLRKVLSFIPFAFAYFFGLLEFLKVSVLVSVIIWVLNSYLTHRILKVSFKKQVLPLITYAFFSSAIILLLNTFLTEMSFVSWILRVLVYVVSYAALLRMISSPVIYEFKQLASLLHIKVSKGETR